MIVEIEDSLSMMGAQQILVDGIDISKKVHAVNIVMRPGEPPKVILTLTADCLKFKTQAAFLDMQPQDSGTKLRRAVRKATKPKRSKHRQFNGD